MATKNFLAVDLGAESGRTVVGRLDGSKIALEETHRFGNGAVRVFDSLHWDALRLWQEIKTGIGKSVAAFGKPAAIGIDTWGVDFGLLGFDGGLVANPVHYRDKRTDGMMELAFSKIPQDEIYRVTGLQFLKFNTLFQMLALANSSRGKPFDGVDKFLFVPDLFNYFLTGVAKAEYTIASTSQMLDARSQQWATGILDRLGIPTRILPEIVPTGSTLGPVLASVAGETGAKNANVIACAGHDTAAAVVGVPGVGDDWCYISSGTWSLMGAELPAPAITDQTLADNFTNEGGLAGTIRFLKNIGGLWLVQECRRGFERAGRKFDYDQLTKMAAAAKPFGPIVDPNHDSFLNPDDMPTAIRAFCVRTGQVPPEDDAALIRCCLESLALRYRRTLEQLEAGTGKSYRVIHIVGGGSRNADLCQWTADCCQRIVSAGPVEATAIGNCIVQAIAVGELKDLAQGRDLVRRSFETVRYEPRQAKGWDDLYQRFLAF